MLQGHGIMIGELYETNIRASVYGIQAMIAKVLVILLPFFI
jgi:hypothetical protein